MNYNAATAYKNNSIQTASKAELTLMLYEGAIKFCNIALMAIEKKDIEQAHVNIIKAQKIIVEFRCTLDFKYPVAKDFDVVYEYLKKDPDILNEALKYIREMRDTWKEVMKANKTGK